MIKLKLIILFLVISIFCIKNSYSASEENIYEKIDLFSEVLNKINKEYVDEVDQSEAMDLSLIHI